MGHEYAGTVLEVGDDVGDYEPGDRVVEQPIRHCGSCFYCQRGEYNICEQFEVTGLHHDGSWADRISVSEEHLHRIPDGVSLADAAIAEPASIATRTVIDDSRIEPEDVVPVEGPGPIGLLSAQVARAAGAS